MQSECLLYYSEDDYELQSYLILNPNHGKRPKNVLPVDLNFQREQLMLLQRMVKFVHSKKCRRVEVLGYLEAKEDEIKKIIINETCCDNCHKVLDDGTSPYLLYEGMSEDSSIDLSDELRLLLLSINTKMKLSESLSLLHGQNPSYNIEKKALLTTFGMGKKKEKGWWQGLVMLIVGNHLTMTNEMVIVTKNGKKFMRNKSQKAILQPNKMMRKFMEKRHDIDLYWEGNEIKSRPKQIYEVPNNFNVSYQDLKIIQETLDFDMTEFDDDTLKQTLDFDMTKSDDYTLKQTLEGLDEEFLKEMNDSNDTEPPCKIQKLI